MAAPEYVPTSLDQEPRKGMELPPARKWLADRPADLGPRQPVGPKFGAPGPDQGYALKLVRYLEDRIEVAPDEHREDAVSGCLGVALRRAALFGRAPVIHDLELAFTVWGFLGGAPNDLLAFRKPLFESAHHHYWDQREIVDRVPDETLRLTPAQARERLATDWRSLLRT